MKAPLDRIVFAMAKVTLLVIASLVCSGWSEKMDRHRRGDKIYAKSPDDRCGHQLCPPGHSYGGDAQGYTLQGGAFVKGRVCHHPEWDTYTRGAGYGWNWGDMLFDFYGASMERCIKDHPVVGCEKHGLLVYPKCQWGFQNSGCCICTQACGGKWVRKDFNINSKGFCLLPCT